MDYHKKEWEERGVVLDKPRRGREMVTTEVPKDLLDTMRMMTAKQQLKDGKEVKKALKTEREGDVELYHEGWVDGKKYLVPDSNLEIMKDLVNLRVRRKGDSVYVQKKDYEASKLTAERTLQRKLRALSEKIDELEAAKLLKKKSIYETSEDKSAVKSTASSVERRKPFEIVPMTDESTTFLISGHIRENSSPLYIIQKYKGKSPFGKRRSDFSEVKSSRDVDILISGNFFRKSILEEGILSIEGIRLKWNLLVPVDERSKLYERRFTEHFNIKGIDILFEGDFIKQKGRLNYTPILTFLVPQPPSPRGKRGGRHDQDKRKNLYKSISSLFSRKNVTTYNVQLENKPSMKSTTDDYTSRGDSSGEGNWSSTEGLGEDVPTGSNHTTEPNKRSLYGSHGDAENDNESCKIHFVMLPYGNGKRSVAGGSSSIKLPKDMSNTTTSEQNDPSTTSKEWHNLEVDNEEETIVVFATRDDLWIPVVDVKPSLRSDSSQSTVEESICDKGRNDQGDTGHDGVTAEFESEERSRGRVNMHAIGGLRPKNLPVLEQKTSSKNETTKDGLVLCEIPEYRCQVRPSKGSQKNCVLRSISKFFSR